ncbi:hypothetical protein AWM75_06605 [Aerococcus urinaehominis]|uniref:Uncharacterized protein n=2 Tax=Aerococcus urinaehominis TaxID=128944 RepID=A0A109RGU8_9LACT|nr:hypothetical protein AWM75_06605 [Aerococcus urinaehominis]SDL89784.1 Uncharacterized membrane protein YeaQ/YmgE, transglycosylase-associated protein family [Aerococcus urinaehominis]
MGWIFSLIVGGIIGWLAGLIAGRDVPGGVVGNIIAGLLGSSLGGWLFGDWGPTVSGMAVVPATIGAVILVLLFSLISRKM